MGVAKAAIDYVPFVYKVVPQANLAGTDLQVPPLRSYLPALVSFMKVHPELGSEAMV